MESGTGNRLLGNRIGTDVTGTAALGNSDGVLVRAESTDVIGNVVSGNAGDGVMVEATSLVLRNRIGTTASGAAALPNGQDGIGSRAGTVIGMAASGNLISANGDDGIASGPAPTARWCRRTRSARTPPAPRWATATTASSPTHPVSRSRATSCPPVADHGLSVLGADSVVEGNTIGAAAGAAPAALGNAAEGIEISGDGSRVAHNEITQNGTDGVRSAVGSASPSLSNTISDNGDLGIDLGASGVTPNDAGDVDAGANDLLNFPTVPVAVHRQRRDDGRLEDQRRPARVDAATGVLRPAVVRRLR